MKTIISEFMDGVAVGQLREGFDVVYDPSPVDQPDALHRAVAAADALIVRNRTPTGSARICSSKFMQRERSWLFTRSNR